MAEAEHGGIHRTKYGVSKAQPPAVCGYQMDRSDPLYKLFYKRIKNGRDLKIIITAEDSATGVGKTTLACWLALSWNPVFTGETWSAETGSTLDVSEYQRYYRDLPPGSVLILDEAEQLDARRSNANKNVNFSHTWMMMRTRQIVSILTLPAPSALDKRLEELADVWINVESRGKAVCHGIHMLNYGTRNKQTPRTHYISWPDVSTHPEAKHLDRLKQEMIDENGEKEKMPSPDEVEKQTKKDIAQQMRDNGATLREIGEVVGYSRNWVSEHTEKPDSGGDG